MKRFGWLLPLLLLFGLLTFPTTAFDAASDAALLWWTRVLPSLLPYLIAASLLVRSGIFLRVKPRLLPLAMLLCGALGGYPVGARLAAQLQADDAISKSDAERAAVLCSLPNPVFLCTVVATGFFGDANAAFPLLIGVYGAALLCAFPMLRMSVAPVAAPRGLSGTDLSDAIADGVKTVGVIGGCLVFASVLGALLSLPFGRIPAVSTAIGLFEMTVGIRAAAVLPLPLSVRLAICAFFAQFGGLSILLQVRAQTPVPTAKYLLTKLVSALLSAALCYLLTPLFCKASVLPTFASAQEMRQNAFSLASVTLSAGVGLLFVFVFTVGLSRHGKARTPKHAGK